MRPTGLAFLMLAAACAHTSRSMLTYQSLRAERPGYHAELYADGDVLVLRVDDPGGVNLVPYEPTIADGTVVVEAGLWSGGNRGAHVHCLHVGATGDWWTRVYFREPDGSRPAGGTGEHYAVTSSDSSSAVASSRGTSSDTAIASRT